MDTSGGKLDEHQHVERPEPDGFHCEEVGGDDSSGLRGGPAGRYWLAGDREGATSLVTVEMAERLTLSGSEEQVATRLRAYADRRIVPLVYPVTRRGVFIDDFEATITRIADAYRARVPRAMPP